MSTVLITLHMGAGPGTEKLTPRILYEPSSRKPWSAPVKKALGWLPLQVSSDPDRLETYTDQGAGG